jgi:hypothetical protein
LDQSRALTVVLGALIVLLGLILAACCATSVAAHREV